jgi:predicted flap endonuclease-1-like 5' DNA nuclease
MLRKTWLLPFFLLAALSGCAQQTATSQGLPWWGWLIIILVIFLLFWLVFRSRPEEEVKTPPLTPKAETPPPAAVVTPVSEEKAQDMPVPAAEEVPMEVPQRAAEIPMASASAPIKPDDLTIVEGIGPKINGILQAAGVNTFQQLAALEPQHIMEILTAAGIRLADPKSWPEQARLAAHGEMDRLKAYQDTLKGGRMA